MHVLQISVTERNSAFSSSIQQFFFPRYDEPLVALYFYELEALVSDYIHVP